MKTILEVKSLTKSFHNAKALSNISFSLFENETIGLVGESGCGKSLIAKTLVRIIPKSSGSIFYREKDIQRLNFEESQSLYSKIQIIFQDPYSSLNPKMRIGDIIAEPLDIHKKLSKEERKRHIEDLLQAVGLERSHQWRFPYEFSGGQRQRVGIARALALNPEILICDEPISSLDVSTQSLIINLLLKLQKERGLTLFFISHDLSVVRRISHRIFVMYLGHLIEIGESSSIYQSPKHPYTEALLSSIPLADPILEKKRPKIVLKGEVPSIFNLPQGCPFHPRCPKSMDICRTEMPKWHSPSPQHSVYCHLFAEH